MITLSDILAKPGACGVYILEGDLMLEKLERLALEYRLTMFTLHGKYTRGKEEFLNHAAAVLRFPDYFGNNWDAFEDSLTDMSWIEHDGLMIVYADCQEFADYSSDEFAIAVDVLKEAAEYWRKEGKRFLALLHGTGGREWNTPRIST